MVTTATAQTSAALALVLATAFGIPSTTVASDAAECAINILTSAGIVRQIDNLSPNRMMADQDFVSAARQELRACGVPARYWVYCAKSISQYDPGDTDSVRLNKELASRLCASMIP